MQTLTHQQFTGRPLPGASSSRLADWDIFYEPNSRSLPLLGFQGTVRAVSGRAAVYQWRKGHAVPRGYHIRVFPGMCLF